MHERYRRQTDGRTTTNSEREHEFTFAKNQLRFDKFTESLKVGTFLRQSCLQLSTADMVSVTVQMATCFIQCSLYFMYIFTCTDIN